MYANHIGPNMTVELHITHAEVEALPPAARFLLRECGTLIDDDPVLKGERVYHIAHDDSIVIEDIIDEAAG